MGNWKLTNIRMYMQEEGFDGYVVYMTDPHLNHFPAPRDKRIAFITGFTGSAGTALITHTHAYFWTDGRYFVQAERQIEEGWTIMRMTLPGVPSLGEFVKASDLKKIGFDMNSTTVEEYMAIKKHIKEGVSLLHKPYSLVDYVYNKPTYNTQHINIHNMQYAGEKTAFKINKIRQNMRQNNVHYLFLSAIDNNSWLLNLRGRDLPYTVLFYSYVLVSLEDVRAYIYTQNLTDDVFEYLKENNITVCDYHNIDEDMRKLSIEIGDKIISMDEKTTFYYYYLFKTQNVFIQQAPPTLMKAIKNENEIEAMKNAHRKDGVALAKFFCWLDEVKDDQSVYSMTEDTLADKVNELRSQQEGYITLTFPTISAIGCNAALPHYNYPKTDKDDIRVKREMYLQDGGAHYVDGTTDITRCVHLGVPTDYEKHAYTLVLKGHICVANMVFPENTKGPHIDAFARQFLWKVGLDFLHGTGHGLGAALNCHEGPIKIDNKLYGPYIETNIVSGMIITNEPAFYDEENKFGVRIENTLVCREKTTKYNFKNYKFFGFETISYVPIETNMIDMTLLTKEEVEWLNDYHKMVYQTISPLLENEQKQTNVDNAHVIRWLKAKTSPI